jgi:hypothetical protein
METQNCLACGQQLLFINLLTAFSSLPSVTGKLCDNSVYQFSLAIIFFCPASNTGIPGPVFRAHQSLGWRLLLVVVSDSLGHSKMQLELGATASFYQLFLTIGTPPWVVLIE